MGVSIRRSPSEFMNVTMWEEHVWVIGRKARGKKITRKTKM
jgi:hypothetical protein